MTCDHPVPTEGDVTEISVVGADCPWCLNHTLDQLREVTGVTGAHASMTGMCIQVTHLGADVPSLLAVVRACLHGTASSSNEMGMVAIDPQAGELHCAHGTTLSVEAQDLVVRPRRPMETLTDAMIRLRAAGYCNDFSATDDGWLECSECGARALPEDMTIDETVRFEGDSNPDDEAILVAVACACGCLGQYSAAYGPGTPAKDAEVLRRLPLAARRPAGDPGAAPKGEAPPN